MNLSQALPRLKFSHASVGRRLNISSPSPIKSPIKSPNDVDLGEFTPVEFTPTVFNVTQMSQGQVALRAIAQMDGDGKKKKAKV